MAALAYFGLAVLAVSVCLLLVHAANIEPGEPLVSTTVAPGEPFELEFETIGAKRHALWFTFRWEGPGDSLDQTDDSTPALEIDAEVFVAPPGSEAARLRTTAAVASATAVQAIHWFSGANHGTMTQAEPGHWRSRTSVTATRCLSRLKAVPSGSRMLIRGRIAALHDYPAVPFERPKSGLEHYVDFELFVTSPVLKSKPPGAHGHRMEV